jgi:hypothetical protein
MAYVLACHASELCHVVFRAVFSLLICALSAVCTPKKTHTHYKKDTYPPACTKFNNSLLYERRRLAAAAAAASAGRSAPPMLYIPADLTAQSSHAPLHHASGTTQASARPGAARGSKAPMDYATLVASEPQVSAQTVPSAAPARVVAQAGAGPRPCSNLGEDKPAAAAKPADKLVLAPLTSTHYDHTAAAAGTQVPPSDRRDQRAKASELVSKPAAQPRGKRDKPSEEDHAVQRPQSPTMPIPAAATQAGDHAQGHCAEPSKSEGNESGSHKALPRAQFTHSPPNRGGMTRAQLQTGSPGGGSNARASLAALAPIQVTTAVLAGSHQGSVAASHTAASVLAQSRPALPRAQFSHWAQAGDEQLNASAPAANTNRTTLPRAQFSLGVSNLSRHASASAGGHPESCSAEQFGAHSSSSSAAPIASRSKPLDMPPSKSTKAAPKLSTNTISSHNDSESLNAPLAILVAAAAAASKRDALLLPTDAMVAPGAKGDASAQAASSVVHDNFTAASQNGSPQSAAALITVPVSGN